MSIFRRRSSGMKRWVQRDRHGVVTVDLEESEQQALRDLLEQLRELLLAGDSPAIRRLYPTAYPQHDELESEYRAMVHDSLLGQRLDAIDAMQSTLAKPTLTDDETSVWMNVVNSVRLTLGTALDVSEDDTLPDLDHPDASQHVLYYLLGALLEQIVDVMFDTVPEEGIDDDPLEGL